MVGSTERCWKAFRLSSKLLGSFLVFRQIVPNRHSLADTVSETTVAGDVDEFLDPDIQSMERCTFESGQIDKCDDGLRMFGTNGAITLVGTESSSQSANAFSMRSSSPGNGFRHAIRYASMPMLASALKAPPIPHIKGLQAPFNLGLSQQI